MASVSYDHFVGNARFVISVETYGGDRPFRIEIIQDGKDDTSCYTKNPDQLRRLAKALERCADFYEENNSDDDC